MRITKLVQNDSFDMECPSRIGPSVSVFFFGQNNNPRKGTSKFWVHSYVNALTLFGVFWLYPEESGPD